MYDIYIYTISYSIFFSFQKPLDCHWSFILPRLCHPDVAGPEGEDAFFVIFSLVFWCYFDVCFPVFWCFCWVFLLILCNVVSLFFDVFVEVFWCFFPGFWCLFGCFLLFSLMCFLVFDVIVPLPESTQWNPRSTNIQLLMVISYLKQWGDWNKNKRHVQITMIGSRVW